MKWLSILKNKAGKFTLGTAQMAGIAGAGILLAYGAFETDNALDKPQQVRSLTSISDDNAYVGMERTASGHLTSMRIKDGLNQVATREERERMEGGSRNNDFGLNAVPGLEGRMGAIGSAATTSTTEGLGMGANAAVEIVGGGTGTSGRANGPARVPGRGDIGAQGGAGGGAGGGAEGAGNGGESGSGPRLAAASMARASGNAFNAAAGAITGGNAGGAGSSGRGGGASGEGYQFTGSMPGSSSAVASLSGSGNAPETRGSGFLAASRRSSIHGDGRHNGHGDLKDISKRSADAAANRFKSSNEGSRAFLAAGQDSGGMTIEGGVETETTGTADFETEEIGALKGMGSWEDDQDDFYEEQKKARERLEWMMIALVVGTVLAMKFGYQLIKEGTNKAKTGATPAEKAAGAAMVAWGWVILGVMMAYAATVMGFAIHYMCNYNGLFMPITSMVVGAAAIVALTMAGVKAAANSTLTKEKDKFQKGVKTAFSGVMSTAAVTGAQTAIDAGKAADDRADENPHNE